MTDTVVHEKPIWREQANFVIAARIVDSSRATQPEWEQLWARQSEEGRFQICCIPFFIYDLALGDEVETENIEGKNYVLNRVIVPSGRYTFRVWFLNPAVRPEIIAAIESLGCLIEERWPGSKLIAIDAADNNQATSLASLLSTKEAIGGIKYETGRTT